MPEIYIAAAFTVGFTLLTWGGLLYGLSGQRWRYHWLIVLGLPLSAVVNLWVKLPVAVLIGRVVGQAPVLRAGGSLAFNLFLFMLSPIFEELIKGVPLWVPGVRRLVTDRAAALWVGYALGIGFGLGEALYLAYNVAQDAFYVDYPWYYFSGYIGERWLVTLLHGMLTAVFIVGIQRGRWGILAGFGGAMALHALINSGVLLLQLGLVSRDFVVLQLGIAALIVIAVFEALRRRAVRAAPAAEEVIYFRREV